MRFCRASCLHVYKPEAYAAFKLYLEFGNSDFIVEKINWNANQSRDLHYGCSSHQHY